MCRYYSATVLLLAALAPSVLSAGWTSHNTAARRASQYEYFGPASQTFRPDSYYGLAMARPDAIQGGAPFPDYLYFCGDDHDAGEAAHWSPFQVAAADYIREYYPNWESEGRDGPGAGLVAFFLGVTSHYIVDMNWHGLETVPSGEGIIRTMGFSDFNCTDGDLCQTAHSAADTGGEFAAAKALNISWYPSTRWYIPTEDLVKIYSMVNITVEPSWINECAVLFYAGSFGVSIFGDVIYDVVMAKRVGGMLLEEYLDFPVGGIDDDAAWTSFMWNRFADWVSNGPPPDPVNSAATASVRGLREVGEEKVMEKEKEKQKSRLRLRQATKKRFAGAIREALYKHSVLPLRGEGSESGKKPPPLFSVSYSEKHSVYGSSGIYIERGPLKGNGDVSRAVMRSIAEALVDEYVLAGVGQMENDADVDRDALVGELYSRVDLLLSGGGEHKTMGPAAARAQNESGTVLEPVAQSVQPHEYFGSSITVADFSGSGKACDLLVGSYGRGRTGGPQEGAATILFEAACPVEGKDKRGKVDDGYATIVFRGGNVALDDIGEENGEAFSKSPPSYERFGWSSAALDVNDDGFPDAVICAPSFGGRNVSAAVGNYSGRCDIFLGPFAPSKSTKPIQSTIAYPVPSFSIYGDKIWGLFGHAVVTGDIDGDGKDDLVISAPGAGSYPELAPNDRGDISSQGAVYVFLHSSFAEWASGSIPKKQRRMVTTPLLASSAADWTLQREESFQFFGRSLAIGVVPGKDSNGHGPLLFVGAPMFHSKVLGEENSAVGRVYAYSFPRAQDHDRGVIRDAPLTIDYLWSVTGCGHAGRTGQTIAYSPSLDAIALSEPAYNATQRRVDPALPSREKILRSGRVMIFPLSSIVTGPENRDFRICEMKDVTIIDGSETEGRFGSSISFFSSSSTTSSSSSFAYSKSDLSPLRDRLLIGAPLAIDGAGTVQGYDLSRASTSSTSVIASAQSLFTVTGTDVSEGKGRLGSAVSFLTGTGTDDMAIVGAPLANLAGSRDGDSFAPDFDQVGGLYSFVLSSTADRTGLRD